MIDDFFSRQRSNAPIACKDFQDTMNVLAKQAFRMFLGVTADVTSWDAEHRSCSLIMKDNPLSDFVVLPAQLREGLWYSNVLVGVIRGALEMINLKTKVYFLKDFLRGDPECEIRVELEEELTDKYEEGSD